MGQEARGYLLFSKGDTQAGTLPQSFAPLADRDF